MNVPLQVKKAAEQANAIQAQLVEEQKKVEAAEQGAPSPAPEGEAPPPAGEQAAPPAAADQQFSGAPAGEPAGEGGEEAAGADWEEKYRTIAGKYSSEVPKLHKQVKELQDKLDNMRNLFARMEDHYRTGQQPPVQAAPQVAPQGTPQGTPEPLLSVEEVEEYGDDLIDVMGRAGKAAVSPELAALRQELAQLKAQMGSVSQHVVKSEREQMFDILTKEVPDWRRINESQEFLDWLAQPDPYSGFMRQEMLDHASGVNDATRIINFFRGFLRESNAVAPTSQTGSRQAKRNLEDMVTPGAGRSGTVSAPKGAERNWSQRDIASFYRDVRDGKYKNDPKQKDAIERQILKAVNEGRVTA